jgi:hypothetical protein
MRAKEKGNQIIIRMLVEKDANTIPQDGANTTPQEKGATPESLISTPDEGANTTPQEKGANITLPQENEATTTPQEKGATPEGPISELRQARKCFSCLCL